MTTKTSMVALHHQLSSWLDELKFYKDELTILNNRLQEVVSKNNGHEIMAYVEHFQNRFIILAEEQDKLKSNLSHAMHDLDSLIENKQDHIYENFLEPGGAVVKMVDDFVTSFRNIRREFNSFLSRVM